MRYLLAGVLGLALLTPAWADDKKIDKAPESPKTLKEQVAGLCQGFEKEMNDLIEQFKSAKTPEEQAKIRDKAMKQVTPDYLKKLMALAVDHPKDPAAADALVFVCTNQYLAGTPQATDAFKTLLKDHPGSDQLGSICGPLTQRPDGDRMIRQVMEKATNPAVKAQAGFFLAQALQDKDDATAEMTKEAEKLLEGFVAAAKTVKGLPPEMVEEASGSLKLFVGKPAPVSTAKDLDDKAVALSDLKGKVVVLDFWFTNCGWCVKMIPHEREMVKRNAGKPFVLVSISTDPTAKMVKDFVEKEPMPWTHWFAGQQGAIVKTWRVQGFPTFFVIDAKGVIRGKVVGGGPDSEKKLDELVDKLVKELDGKGAE
jgi:cytochrome oxidase Cu insertion factor (SCO1/SenC/PrrC family)